MLSLISKLQRKPEHVRKKIALVASLAVTGAIIVFWLVSIASSVGKPAPKAISDEKEAGPFEALIEGLGGVFADTAETLQAAARTFSKSSKETPTTSSKEPKEDAETPALE